MAANEVATRSQTDVSRITPAPGTIRALLQASTVQEQFERALGDKTKAGMFIASLATLVYANKKLAECDPQTVIASALQAAALDLPINPNLGFAYLVPYKGKAQFQPGYRGIVQLALRTGQYHKLEVHHAMTGEVAVVNRFTGTIRFAEPKDDKPVGVLAYLRLVSGFEKFNYWTLDRIHAHAKRYSQSYEWKDGAWKTSTDAMERKTVLGDLVRKWGVMSVELVRAFQVDEPEFAGEPPTPEQRARDRAGLFGADPETGEIAAGAPPAPTPADNAALDREVMEADKAKA